MLIALLWFVLAIVVGAAAGARGRSGFGWFVLALLISPLIAGLIIAVLPDLKTRGILEKLANGGGVDDRAHKQSVRHGALPPTGVRVGAIVGDGAFRFPVVGESHHQAALEHFAGGRSAEGAHCYCAASVAPQPENPYDPEAVAVSVRGAEVGFLARPVNREFLVALSGAGFTAAACEAVIVGGWDRGDGDRGAFGIYLNACRPFRFMTVDQWRQTQPQSRERAADNTGTITVIVILAVTLAVAAAVTAEYVEPLRAALRWVVAHRTSQ